MTESQFKTIEDFTSTLAEKRQMVSDRELLDQCQAYLTALVGLVNWEKVGLEPDPPPTEPSQTQSQ